jgi:hypothetical protein
LAPVTRSITTRWKSAPITATTISVTGITTA